MGGAVDPMNGHDTADQGDGSSLNRGETFHTIRKGPGIHGVVWPKLEGSPWLLAWVALPIGENHAQTLLLACRTWVWGELKVGQSLVPGTGSIQKRVVIHSVFLELKALSMDLSHASPITLHLSLIVNGGKATINVSKGVFVAGQDPGGLCIVGMVKEDGAELLTLWTRQGRKDQLGLELVENSGDILRLGMVMKTVCF